MIDPFDDDDDAPDWESMSPTLAEIEAEIMVDPSRFEIESEDLEGEQDHDGIDPDVAYDMGYAADAYADNPFEHGTEAADRWSDGQLAAELDAMQSGELPTRYRDPD